MSRGLHASLGLLAMALAACSSGLGGSVREAATADLGCPSEQITVEDEGDGHYLARGCGQHARYAFHADGACSRRSCQSRRH